MRRGTTSEMPWLRCPTVSQSGRDHGDDAASCECLRDVTQHRATVVPTHVYKTVLAGIATVPSAVQYVHLVFKQPGI